MEDQPKRSATHNHTWGVASVEESRWPATVAVVAAVILYLSLPDRFTLAMGVVLPGSYRIPLNWLLPAFELILLVPLSIRAPHRKQDEPPWQRRGAVAIIAAINVANFYSLFLLVGALISGKGTTQPLTGHLLFLSAMEIWLTNVLVFALWYWELDRGGPDERTHMAHRQPDFLFPQMTTPDCTYETWTPRFLDYLYTSFTNATAFSPTDTLPLTPWAKFLMLIQSLGSLVTVALVAARAVNILT